MRKCIAIGIILLILIVFGVSAVFADPDPEQTTGPAETTAAVPETVPAEEPEQTEPAETTAAVPETAPAGEPEQTEPAETTAAVPETAPAEEPEQTEPTEPQEPVLCSLQIRRSDPDPDRAYWYTVEAAQPDGGYLPLVQVAILPGETSVTVAGLSPETDYRVTEHIRTSDKKSAAEQPELVRLTEQEPDQVMTFSATPSAISWLTDSSSCVVRKGE